MFNVSRGGYYQFINSKPSKRKEDDGRLLVKISVIHEASRHTYGSQRVHAELREGGETCSRKRVAKIMHQAGVAK